MSHITVDIYTRAKLVELETELAAVKAERDAMRVDAESKQAKIDSLMIEYCQDEMTPEQIAEWERHQVVVDLVEKRIAKGAA